MGNWASRVVERVLLTDETTRRITGSAGRGRFLGWIFLAGAGIGTVSMIFPQPPGADVAALYALYGVAGLIGAGLIIWGSRLPEVALQAAVACGTVLVSLGIVFTEERTGVYAMFYVWIAVMAFYFFSRTAALVQVGLTALLYTLVLANERPSGVEEQWLITIGTVLGAGLLVGLLRARVERLVARLFEAARTDPLTEIRNRRGFEEQLEVELERSIATASPVSVAVADLDRFKAVNDELGHQAGDRVLKRFAEELGRVKRGMDVAGRVGGEEFAVVLPATDKQMAYLFAERLRTAVLRAFAEDPVPITVSVGVASHPVDAPTAEALLGAGDQALYAAKQLGRDRSVLYSPAVVSGLLSEQAAARARDDGQLTAVLVLAETLDLRDAGTARHSQTVSRFACLTGHRLGLGEAQVEELRLAGILHDIGKIGIGDSILQKAAPLSEEEWVEMRKHPEIGARILRGAGLERIAGWIFAHHEREDGTGYPLASAGGEIPLEAKILAVADAYEAMTSDRVYRLAMSHEAAQEELERCAGAQFDPVVVEALIAAMREHGAPAGSTQPIYAGPSRIPEAPTAKTTLPQRRQPAGS